MTTTTTNIATTLTQLVAAHGMTMDDLRRDRRYRNARGDERIVLDSRGTTTHLYIVEAPPWLPCDDFGPLGMTQSRRAGLR